MAEVAKAAPAESGKKHTHKPEKPDQAEFEKNLKAAQDEHDKVRQKLNEVKAKLEFVKAPGKDPRQQQLREELNSLRASQSSKKNDRAKLDEQIKALEASVKAKIKDQNAAKGKIPYKSVEELDAAIKNLEKKVETGTMKMVDERKALADISSLQKQRKNFGGFEASQKAIDEDKKKLEELRQKRKDPEVQELSDKYEAVKKELDNLKAEQDEVFANLNKLRDERSSLLEQQQEKWKAIQKIRDEYYAARDAYREYDREARRIRKEKRAKEEKEFQEAKRRQIAQQKMEEASQKAYTSEILTCEGLIGFFDPSSAEAARKAKLSSEPRALAAQATRTVDDTQLKGKKVEKKEEDYFIGKPKKGKKGKKNPEASSPTAESPASGSGAGLSLNAGIFEEFSKLDISPPNTKDEVPKVLEQLREKLAWYKENQEQKTAENIAKAQKEIDRLEAEAAKEEDEGSAPENGTSTPKGEKTTDAPVEEKEEKTEENAE